MRAYLLRAVIIVIGILLSTETNRAAQTGAEKLPVLDCTVVFSKGNFDAYGGPKESDTLRLDIDQLRKRAQLEFKSRIPGPSYIPIQAPFRIVREARDAAIDLHSMRLVSESRDGNRSERKVTIDIMKRRPAGKRIVYEIWLVSESGGFMDGFAILEGVARTR